MLNLENLSYSIGQVSTLTEIAQSTLRYWETVISDLDPFKTAGGSRRYSKVDIELILKIKDLLYTQGLTIKGANLHLKNSNSDADQKITIESASSKKHDLDKNENFRISKKELLKDLIKIKNILDK